MAVVKQAITDLSKSIKEDLKLEDGVIVDSSTFEKNLPENMDLDTVHAVQDHIGQHTAAFTHAAAELTLDAMIADTDLTSVTASTTTGRATFSAVIGREQTYPGIGDKPAVTKHGTVRTKMESKIVKKVGDLGAVCNEINKKFEDALASS